MFKSIFKSALEMLERHVVEPIMTRQAECDQHEKARFEDIQATLLGRLTALELGLHSRAEGQAPASLTTRLADTLYLGNDEVLTRTVHGYYMVVPGYNIDVAVGLVRDGIIEPWTSNVVRHILKPGDVYINVGANFGYYTLLGAQLVGRQGTVYAIEANPHVFTYLVKSVYWGGYPDVVKAYNVAAYSSDGDELTLQFDPQFIGGGSVMAGHDFGGTLHASLWRGENIRQTLDAHNRFAHRGLFCTVHIDSTKLDTLIGDQVSPRLLHMDIEGAEADALLGAAQMLAQHPDLEIIVEWLGTRLDEEFAGPKYRQVARFLSSLGFKFYRIETDNFRGLGTPPRLREFNVEQLNATGHCDLLLTRKLAFQVEMISGS